MKASLRALIVDDERLARKRLRQLLEVHDGIEITGEADSVDAAAAFAAKERPEVIFLDIQMPPRTGFELLPLLNPVPKIVFVTAYDMFAIRAFEANALDYLLKPVKPERMAETVRRLLSLRGENENPPAPAGENTKLQVEDLVALRDKGEMRMLPVGNIAAIEAEGAYTRVILSNQSAMLILRTIGDWEERLPFPPFVRVDRSLLINLRLVRGITVESRDNTLVQMAGVSSPLILGRSASIRLRKEATAL